MRKKAFLFLIFLLILSSSCSKKIFNYYTIEEKGGLVGVVYPKDSGARVSAWQGIEVAWTYIDSTGYFKIENLPVGTYTVKVEAEDYYTYESDDIFTIYGGGTTTTGVIKLYEIPGIITSTYPSDGATDIPLDVQIKIDFAIDMDTVSVEQAFSINPEVEGSFVWGERKWGKYLRFIPSSDLKANTVYTVTLDTTAHDIYGVGLSEPFIFSFTTRGIKVVYFEPQDGSIDVPTGYSIYIRFNSIMDQKSVFDALSIDPEGEYDFSWSYNNMSIRLRPESGYWRTNTLYTVKLDTTARDTSGVSLSDSLVFSFTIEGVKVSYHYPYDKNIDVGTHTYIRIRFNTLMNQRSVVEAFSIFPTTEGEFFWSDLSEFHFYPESDLASDSNYSVKIDTTAYDLYGSNLEKEISFGFRTEPIRIISERPENGETYVDPKTSIYVCFNTSMDQASVVNAFKMVNSDSIEVMGSFSWNGLRGMTFYPDTTLENNKEYLITISTQAKDLHEVFLPKPFVLWFKTKPSE